MADAAPLGLIHFNHVELDGGGVSWEAPTSGTWKPNYGDMLVCGAVLRQLAPTDTVRYMFGDPPPQPVSAGLVRGSTYLNRKFDFDAATRTLEMTDAPLAVVGLGAQSPDSDHTFLDDVPGARRFVEVLMDRSASISVRGHFTATVLERLGARNLRVTGCPSMFYSLSAPTVAVPASLADDSRSLGVSLHTGLYRSRFCRSPRATLRKHQRTIAFAERSAAHVSLFEQGVVKEYIVGDTARPLAERLEAAEEILARFPGPRRVDPQFLVDHVVSVTGVEDWLARAREVDAMLGFRFHGNMVALTQGLPCFYFVYDSRITEFCELYRLPYQDVEDPWTSPVDRILDHDWDATTRAIHECFRELVAFYEENGIDHTLQATPVPR